MSTPTFTPGDLVRHRISGELGVVVSVLLGPCVIHSHFMGCQGATPCEHKPTDKVEVSFGLDSDNRELYCSELKLDGEGEPSGNYCAVLPDDIFSDVVSGRRAEIALDLGSFLLEPGSPISFFNREKSYCSMLFKVEHIRDKGDQTFVGISFA